MHLIDGKALAKTIREEVKREVATLERPPKLAVLLVGDDPASHLYVSLKKKAAEEAGISIDVQLRDATVSQTSLVEQIEAWNRDPSVDGILVQIPLPAQYDENAIVQTIDPKKDVDGFHPKNIEALLSGQPTMIPPVHEGILRLISQTPLRLPGATAAILVNSDVFSTPLKRLLTTAGVFVHVASPITVDRDLLERAEIVVIAVGRPKFLTPEMVADDAVIIDVGTNKTPDGKTCGDVRIEDFEATDAWISPVPGGVGPMTIAQLLKNVVRAAKR